MLFYLNQFELHLPESSLKKGLQMLHNLEVHKQDVANKYIAKDIEITIHLKNNQLQSYKCTCQKPKYCEHLAAVLFFLQEQKLQLRSKPLAALKIRSKSLQNLNQVEALQQIIYKASLIDFSKRNQKQSNYFDEFLKLLKSYLKSLNPKIPLTQNQIDELLANLIIAHQVLKTNKQNELLFDWQMASYCFFIYLFDYRFSGNENELLELKSKIQNNLNELFFKTLDSKQKQTWLKACLFSLQSNKHLKSKAFYFLCIRYFVLTNKQTDIQKIEELLKKRVYINPYHETLNHLNLTKHVLYFKLHGAPKKINFNTPELIEPEYLMALCEFYFLTRKTQKAFQMLDGCLLYFQKKQIILLRIFTTYAIEKSKTYSMVNRELTYLRTSFIFNIQLNNDELARFIKLTQPHQLKTEIDLLIQQIKETKVPFAFEKLSKLLLIIQDHHALIQLLMHEKNKFNLLHQTVIKITTHVDVALLQLYAKQLGVALQEANTFNRQKQLIVACKDFFALLTEENVNVLSNLIFNETGYESQIGKYISNEFENLNLLK